MIGGASSERFTAYVVFMGADHRRFWRMFTGRGWRHVFVCVPVYWPEPGLNAEEYTLIFDPKANCLQHHFTAQPVSDVVQKLLDEGATCAIQYRVRRKGLPWYIPRGVQNCVSVVKSVLGVAAWYVWTPKHLAYWLLRNGGQLIERQKS